MEQHCYILGSESSCDDTVAPFNNNGKILSNVVASHEIDNESGAVLHELASRAHQKKIDLVVHQALRKANIDKKDLKAIAFFRGAGLAETLIVGSSFLRTLVLGHGVC